MRFVIVFETLLLMFFSTNNDGFWSSSSWWYYYVSTSSIEWYKWPFHRCFDKYAFGAVIVGVELLFYDTNTVAVDDHWFHMSCSSHLHDHLQAPAVVIQISYDFHPTLRWINLTLMTLLLVHLLLLLIVNPFTIIVIFIVLLIFHYHTTEINENNNICFFSLTTAVVFQSYSSKMWTSSTFLWYLLLLWRWMWFQEQFILFAARRETSDDRWCDPSHRFWNVCQRQPILGAQRCSHLHFQSCDIPKSVQKEHEMVWKLVVNDAES